jgi:hypothetical protein
MSQDELLDTFRKGAPKRRTRRIVGGHPGGFTVTDEIARQTPRIPESPAVILLPEPKPAPAPTFEQIARDQKAHDRAIAAKLPGARTPKKKR